MTIDNAITIFKNEYEKLEQFEILKQLLCKIVANDDAHILFEEYRQERISIHTYDEWLKKQDILIELEKKMLENELISKYLLVEEELALIHKQINSIIVNKIEKIYNDVYFENRVE